MGRLTTLGASDRLHVFRPAPTRLKRRLTNNPVAYLDDVYPSLVRHWANLVGRVKALLFWLSHGFSSLVLGLVEAILAPLLFLTAPLDGVPGIGSRLRYAIGATASTSRRG